MKQIKAYFGAHPYIVSFIAGLVSATGFAPLNLWPLTLAAIAVWIAALLPLTTKKSAAFAGWLFGLGHFIVGLNWIAKAFTFQAAMPGWLGYVAVVLLSLYLAIYPALAALGASWLARHRPMVFVFALAGFWIITEWLRSWVFSGFIWNPLGASMEGISNLGSIRLIGTYGYSGIVIIVSALAGALMAAAATLEWRNMARRLTELGIIAIAANIAAWAGKGEVVQPAAPQTPITVVQPNIGQQDKWQPGYEQENLSKLARLTIRDDNIPRLIFWPEAAIPDYLETGYPARYYYGRSAQSVRGALTSFIKPDDILVLGALKLEFDEKNQSEARRAIGARNSVFALNADGKLLGRYDKSHLVPYGEYLPMRPLLSAIGLSRLAPGDFDFWPGTGAASLNLGDFGKIGLQVCYEIIFSGQVVDRNNRPDFIFNPSNDAWFGSWGPPQHLAQARMRAIEEGLPVIRSTPTGISAVIDADGAVLSSLPMAKAGRIDTLLPKAHTPTIFAQFGNVLPLLFAMVLLICAIAIRVRRR